MTSANGQIGIAVSGEPVLFRDGSGRFVVPVSSDRQATRLMEFGRSTACDVALIPDAQRGEATAIALTGSVAALGACGLQVARVYAELTGRSLVEADSFQSLARVPDLEVVFCTWDHVTADLLRLLATGFDGLVPGLICGNDENEIWDAAVLRFIAAAGPTRRASGSWVEVLSTWGGNSNDRGPMTTLGAGAGGDEIRAALSRGEEVASLLCHSGGIEARVAPDLSICTAPFRTARAAKDRSPFCQVTGYCPVHDSSVDRARANDVLMSTGDLCARVLVLGCCYGLYLDRRTSDPAWGIVPSLTTNANVGACVAHWSILPMTAYDFRAFVIDLIESECLGAAAWAYNRQVETRAFGSFACVFGDPRVRPRLAERLGLDRREETPAIERASLDFVRQYLTVASTGAKDEPLESRCTVAMSNVSRLDTLLALGDGFSSSVLEVESSVRGSLLEFFQVRGSRLQHDWIRLGDRFLPGESESCRTCGERCDAAACSFRSDWLPERLLLICPACGIVRDAPLGARGQVWINDQRIMQWSGEPASERWSGAVRITAFDDSESRMLGWPRVKNGEAASAIRLPEDVPPGAVHVSLIMIRGLSLEVYTCAWRPK